MVEPLPNVARRLFCMALVCAGGAVRADPGSPYCEVALDLAVNGHSVASPSAIVEYGKAADITLGDDAHGWRFTIVADEPTVIRRANMIPASVELHELIGGQAVLRASPHVAVAPGQRADIDTIFGEGDGRHAHMSLVARPRSDAEIETMRNAAGNEN